MILHKYTKTIILVCAILFLSCNLLGIGIAYWFQRPQNNPDTIVLIKKGAALSQIASCLAHHEVVDFPFFFKIVVYSLGEWDKLKAGEYCIPAHVTPAQLLHILKAGNVVLHPITLTEGETSYHLTQKLLQDSRFQGDCPLPPEGSLLPETYHFPRGTKREAIIHRMQKEMHAAIQKLWSLRPSNCFLQTPQEMVILASIIEKETALSHERPLIAGVFLNRLKIGMPLQADPTIIYAFTKESQNLIKTLTREDLKYESPYNTYLYEGLPPSPIANPGMASLKAVLWPKAVPYLYFVADGSGGHVFATTLEEHQHNHKEWRKIRDETEKERVN